MLVTDGDNKVVDLRSILTLSQSGFTKRLPSKAGFIKYVITTSDVHKQVVETSS